jgi:hypothetical protein
MAEGRAKIDISDIVSRDDTDLLRDQYFQLLSVEAVLVDLADKYPTAEKFKETIDKAISEIEHARHLLVAEIPQIEDEREDLLNKLWSYINASFQDHSQADKQWALRRICDAMHGSGSCRRATKPDEK